MFALVVIVAEHNHHIPAAEAAYSHRQVAGLLAVVVTACTQVESAAVVAADA